MPSLPAAQRLFGRPGFVDTNQRWSQSGGSDMLNERMASRGKSRKYRIILATVSTSLKMIRNTERASCSAKCRICRCTMDLLFHIDDIGLFGSSRL